MQSTLTVEALYTPEHTLAAPLLRSVVYPWEALAGIRECIRALGAALSRRNMTPPSRRLDPQNRPCVRFRLYRGGRHHRPWDRGAPRGLYPGQRPGRRRRGGRQLHRTEERHPVRQGAGPPLQLCRGFDPGVPFPYGSRIYYLQCQKAIKPSSPYPAEVKSSKPGSKIRRHAGGRCRGRLRECAQSRLRDRPRQPHISPLWSGGRSGRQHL